VGNKYIFDLTIGTNKIHHGATYSALCIHRIAIYCFNRIMRDPRLAGHVPVGPPLPSTQKSV